MNKKLWDLYYVSCFFCNILNQTLYYLHLTDSDVLFIGPGAGSNGQSEVLNIPSLTMANCTPPTFPFAIYGYVATMTVDGPVLCGGGVAACYLLTRSGTWLGTPPMQAMKTSRTWAAAVTLGDAWWVTGKIFSSSG